MTLRPARIDFTYWPETGRVDIHKHDPGDESGDGTPLAVGLADRNVVQSAMEEIRLEFNREMKRFRRSGTPTRSRRDEGLC